MADITIRHDHEGGTRVEGSSKGDGVYEILRALGWTWRSYAGIHIRGSRDKFAYPSELEKHAEALRAADFVVTVEVDNTWRPAAVRWQEREERAEGRAERLDERAGLAAGRATAARDARRQISDGIPLGQPKLVGHHSYARACRDEQRMDTLDRRSFEEADYADHLAARAAGTASNERAKHDPRAIMRKIETLETEIRRTRRSLAESSNPDGEWCTIARLRVERDEEEVAYLRGTLTAHADAGSFVAWCTDNIAKGDHVKVSGRWCEVTRINRKGVSVRNRWAAIYQSDRSSPVTWDEIHGRRRAGQQLDTPNGEPWPVELAQRVARWTRLARQARTLDQYAKYDSPEATEARHTNAARRLVHGLPVTASDAEVAAACHLGGEAEFRELADRSLTIFDRLVAGETIPDVAATVEPFGTPAWRLPDREPEDRRAGPAGWRNDTQPLVQPGDLVKGIYDRGFAGSDRRLLRGFCGPVASVSAVNNRREAGDWVTIRLVGGTEREMQTHMWLAVYPAGTWEDTTKGDPTS